MRICIEKATGRILELQTGGDGEHLEDEALRADYRVANLATLRVNANAAGYSEDAIEVKFVSAAEGEQLIAAQLELERDPQEEARVAQIDAVIRQDTTVASLKAMTAAEFDTWWDANVTNATQAINVLKRVTRVVIRKLL